MHCSETGVFIDIYSVTQNFLAASSSIRRLPSARALKSGLGRTCQIQIHVRVNVATRLTCTCGGDTCVDGIGISSRSIITSFRRSRQPLPCLAPRPRAVQMSRLFILQMFRIYHLAWLSICSWQARTHRRAWSAVLLPSYCSSCELHYHYAATGHMIGST
jgi:hypothetical protein